MSENIDKKPLETPSKEFSDDLLREVPLGEVEHTPKSRYTQLLAVIVAGVALFSDGYNIQVTGELRNWLC